MLTEIACRSESGLCRLGFARLVRQPGRRPCGIDALAFQIFLFPFRPFGVPLHPVQLDLAFLFPLISAIGPVMRVAVRSVYIMEFKLDGTAEEAIKQINDKHYAQAFNADKRKLYKIGINFSNKTRNIERWIVE